MKAARLGTIAVLATFAAAPALAGNWGDEDSQTSVYVEQHGYYDAGSYDWRQGREWRGSARLREIDARQERQRGRIWQGWRSGELTRREMRQLMAEQRAIDDKERHYLADGHLNRWEYADLEHELDEASRRIRHEKHDGNWRGRDRY